MKKQNDFDVHLPPFTIEPTERSIGDRPYSWGVNYLEVARVWPMAKGKGAIVFVLDTEDNAVHPEVFPSVVAEYSKRFTNEHPEIESNGGHGLHVADTVLQVAPLVKIGFLKGLTNEGSGYSTWIGAAIRFAADVELLPEHEGFKRIINMSLGSDSPSEVIKAALFYAQSKGVLVFAAAGNDGRDVDFPGAFDKMVTAIGAIDEQSNPASFSSPGPSVDLAAPGVRIQGAYKTGYASLSGTSMATPHAVGIAALLSSFDVADMPEFMKERATDVHTEGEDEKTGFGVPIAPPYFLGNPPPLTPPDTEKKPTPTWGYIAFGVVIIAVILYFVL